MRRSAGVGLRIFLPIFGMMGLDYGYGFDEDIVAKQLRRAPDPHNFHFTMGQTF